jgi:hypothetical protein
MGQRRRETVGKSSCATALPDEMMRIKIPVPEVEAVY